MNYEDIKNLTIGELLGQKIKFRNMDSRRMTVGIIDSISDNGAHVVYSKMHITRFIKWEYIDVDSLGN